MEQGSKFMMPGWGWGGAVASLVWGGFLAYRAVAAYVNEKRDRLTGQIVVQLSAATALMVVALLQLAGIVPEGWAFVSFVLIGGLLSLMEGTGILPITPGVRKWLAVAAGVVMILWAMFNVLLLHA